MTAAEADNVRCECLEDNRQWMEFRRALTERGVTVQFLWRSKSSAAMEYDDVHCVRFRGDGFQPRVLTAIVLDYCVGRARDKQNGFGLYTDSSTNSMQADVESICGPRR